MRYSHITCHTPLPQTQYGRFSVKNNFDEKTSVGVISYLTLINEVSIIII